MAMPDGTKSRLVVYVDPDIMEWLDQEVAAGKAKARKAGQTLPSRTTFVESVLKKHMAGRKPGPKRK